MDPKLNNILSPKSIIILFLILFSIDLCSKILALKILPYNKQVNILEDNLYFYLVFNSGSSGGQADYLLKNETNKNATIIVNSINNLIIIFCFVLIYFIRINKIHKWLIGIGILIILSITNSSLKTYFNAYEFTNWNTSVFSKISSICIFMAIFFMAKNYYLKLFLSVILSAGMGNLISHFYYPYKIIDFIYVEGLYELFKIGVFNVADLIFNLGLIGFSISIFFWGIGKIRTGFITRLLKKIIIS